MKRRREQRREERATFDRKGSVTKIPKEPLKTPECRMLLQGE